MHAGDMLPLTPPGSDLLMPDLPESSQVVHPQHAVAVLTWVCPICIAVTGARSLLLVANQWALQWAIQDLMRMCIVQDAFWQQLLSSPSLNGELNWQPTPGGKETPKAGSGHPTDVASTSRN